MSAYVIAEFTVKDPDLYREKYAAKAGQTAKEGGEPLASGNWEIVHGDGSLTSGALMRFPDHEPARRPPDLIDATQNPPHHRHRLVGWVGSRKVRIRGDDWPTTRSEPKQTSLSPMAAEVRPDVRSHGVL